MEWEKAQRGKTLQITASIAGGPAEVRAAARHLWAVFQADVIPRHRDIPWDEVRVDFGLDGLCAVYPASTATAQLQVQAVVGLLIPALRDAQDALSEQYWDEETEDFRDGHEEAHRACVEPYVRALLEAIPRSGWTPALAETWFRARGPIVCIADGDDDGEALAEESLLAQPIGTVSFIGPFKTSQPIPGPALALPIAEERAREIVALVADAWVDGLEPAVSHDPAALDRAAAAREERALAFLATATDPHELQCFADACNADTGIVWLREVIRQPACDAGTALSIYWRLRPEFFLQYQTPADVPETSRDEFTLLGEIEARFAANGYASRRIAYDPNRRGMVGLYAEQVAAARRTLPPIMYEPVAPAAAP